MLFEKKLIILSGEKGAKGTLGLERNAYGVFAALNLYNLPDLRDGEYCAGLKSGGKAQVRNLGGDGKILTRFTVDEIDLSAVHCIVYDTAREIPLLYGCNTPAKLWAGNMMDGLGRKRNEPEKENTPPAPPASYSERPPDIKDYFFDIHPGARIALPESAEPPDTDVKPSVRSEAESLLESARRITEYNDGALAEINYYARGNVFSGLDAVDPDRLRNPVDRAVKTETADGCGEKEKSADTYLAQGAARNSPRSLKGNGAKPVSFSPETAYTVPPAGYYTAGDSAAKNRPASVFYEQIKTQLDGLFASGERFELLEELMPETRWVKVQYDDARYYAVGLVGSRPDYICYGVPGDYSPSPPLELGSNCRWLPESPESPAAKGFWLLFQDAVTGEPEL